MSLAGASVNVGTTSTDVGVFTALLVDINPTLTVGGYPQVWTQFTATVTGVPGQQLGRMAFRYFVTNAGPSGANSDIIGIDTVAFNGPCGPTPTPGTPTPTATPTATATATPTATATVPPTATPSPSEAPPSPTPPVTPNPCAGTEFMNSTFIGIPATGTGATTGAPANPYPSNIVVAGLSGTVTKVSVRLGVNHTFPDDLDVLLVGPGGQTALLMSDVGGDADTMSTVILTFDDAAAASLPDGNGLVEGTFKPTNIGGADAFPAPAPAPGDNTLLSIFNGTAPNGTWALYVVDDKESDLGSFSAGWSLTITTVAGCGTPFPSPTVTPSPSATPSPSPITKAINLSTRMRVQTGDNVGIGGFIITGTTPKNVIIRAIGPTLADVGVPDALADPVLELHGPDSFATIINNDWRDEQEAEIQATGIPPTDNFESAIVATLAPETYTAIVRGNGNSSGVALVEVYDLNQGVDSKLANLSTRAFVSTNDNIVIAGFLLSDNNVNDRIIVRGIGPSLAPAIFPASAVLADPTLELRDNNGTLILSNNDWQDNAAQAAEISAAGLAPSNDLESAIAATLPPGLYTALLAGLNNGTGIGVVEIYDRGP
jgi:subtilisin-like proprotein convertase family protein